MLNMYITICILFYILLPNLFTIVEEISNCYVKVHTSKNYVVKFFLNMVILLSFICRVLSLILHFFQIKNKFLENKN